MTPQKKTPHLILLCTSTFLAHFIQGSATAQVKPFFVSSATEDLDNSRVTSVLTPRVPSDAARHSNSSAVEKPLPNAEKATASPENPVANPENPVASPVKPEPSPRRKPQWLFPNWGTANFDWNVLPTLGFETKKDFNSSVTQNTLEVGAVGSLEGIPIYPGNPGVQTAFSAGAGYGLVSLTEPNTTPQAGDYKRWSAGTSLSIPIYFYRSVFSINYGHIAGKLTPFAQNFSFNDDKGILILPYFSVHYTYAYFRLFAENWSQENLHSNDNWIHLRFFTPFLNAFVDFGPGLAFSHFYGGNQFSPNEAAESRVADFRMIAGSNIFWKLGFKSLFRYIVSSDVIPNAQKSVNIRLPSEPLGSPASMVVSPEDSLIGSAFFGLKNLYGGLSVGWQYNFNGQNFFQKNGQKRHFEKRQGVGVSYEKSF